MSPSIVALPKKCPNCEKSFGGRFKYCSIQCAFWSQVDRKADDECWPWIGGTNEWGYGFLVFGVKNKFKRAHRYSYFLHKGEIGDLFVCHTCDNRLCVNPNHLFLGDHKANMHDAWKKGKYKRSTYPRGEEIGNSKMTEADVRQILIERTTGAGARVIARRLGMKKHTVENVIYRGCWSHVKI